MSYHYTSETTTHHQIVLRGKDTFTLFTGVRGQIHLGEIDTVRTSSTNGKLDPDCHVSGPRCIDWDVTWREHPEIRDLFVKVGLLDKVTLDADWAEKVLRQSDLDPAALNANIARCCRALKDANANLLHNGLTTVELTLLELRNLVREVLPRFPQGKTSVDSSGRCPDCGQLLANHPEEQG
jgi:hypothetical protein